MSVRKFWFVNACLFFCLFISGESCLFRYVAMVTFTTYDVELDFSDILSRPQACSWCHFIIFFLFVCETNSKRLQHAFLYSNCRLFHNARSELFTLSLLAMSVAVKGFPWSLYTKHALWRSASASDWPPVVAGIRHLELNVKFVYVYRLRLFDWTRVCCKAHELNAS